MLSRESSSIRAAELVSISEVCPGQDIPVAGQCLKYTEYDFTLNYTTPPNNTSFIEKLVLPCSPIASLSGGVRRCAHRYAHHLFGGFLCRLHRGGQEEQEEEEEEEEGDDDDDEGRSMVEMIRALAPSREPKTFRRDEEGQ